ncbi:hypothetical protein OCGS_0151 [Oceaniovalibus guishaninsula JLT2003]|uniref:DUF2059 domain-containing protein n=1 Tax=Oceaniovalibus guishaninsula JLT2003 TaxID=1231392 RepID=K2HGZ8_9RHOB|nr:DUF2059 domain-containing protein [Oceaniovalibus guishaninsula]EKE45732.1 hypothetical protein OCGS_0151 [Oceaniovalibus guishaninsula JLT2003]
MRLALAAALSLPLLAASVLPAATDTRQAEALYDALRLDDLLAIMRVEGTESGLELEDDLFAGRGGVGWKRALADIYGPDNMEGRMRALFVEGMEDATVTPLLDFFTSDTGAEIVTLELEARRAMADEALEEAAEAALERMQRQDDPRIAGIEAFVEANDLIEQNVVGAMNANYAFMTGLADGGAFGAELGEDQMLADVWSQEPEIRDETLSWLYSYLNLAYQPLDDADLAAYTELSRTPEGQALNRALFAAFDEVYVDISRDLGLAAARFMASEDL